MCGLDPRAAFAGPHFISGTVLDISGCEAIVLVLAGAIEMLMDENLAVLPWTTLQCLYYAGWFHLGVSRGSVTTAAVLVKMTLGSFGSVAARRGVSMKVAAALAGCGGTAAGFGGWGGGDLLPLRSSGGGGLRRLFG